MASFRFWAHSADGETYEGVIDARDFEAVRRELEVRRLIPDRIVPEAAKVRLSLRRAPSSRAVMEFSHQLATLVEAHLPLVDALAIVSGLTRDRPLRNALQATLDEVRAGKPLAEAMGDHPDAFNDIVVATVAAGEEGGTLGFALRRMADYLERRRAVRERLVAAAAYPAVIVAVAAFAVVMLLVLVIPAFEGIFISNGLEMPATTLVFVTLSRFFARFWLVGGVLLTVAVIAFRRWHRGEAGRRSFDDLLLHLPVTGDLVRRVAVARFSRTAASLLSSGVAILEALGAAARTCGNVVIGEALARGRQSVLAGRSLSEQLAREHSLPPLLASMVAVGEETGELDRMLDKVADFHEREVQAAIDGLLKVVEPALVLVVGACLGAIVIAVYLPILDAISSIA